MAKDTEKITLSNNKEVSYTRTIRELVDFCNEIDKGAGQIKLNTLRMSRPGHSSRDYSAAMEVYRDACRQMIDCPVPLPDEVCQNFERHVRMIWKILYQFDSERIEKSTQELNEQLRDSRLAFQNMEDERDKLNFKLTECQQELETLRRQAQESNNACKEQAAQIVTLKADVNRYQEQYAALKESFERLIARIPAPDTGEAASNADGDSQKT